MEGKEDSMIRQRTKNGQRDDQKRTAEEVTAKTTTTTGTNGEKSDRFFRWIFCFVLGTFAIGIVMYRSRKEPTLYQKVVSRECDDGTGKCIVIGDTSNDFGKTWHRSMFFVDKTTVDFEKMIQRNGAEALLRRSTKDASDQFLPDHGRLSGSCIATMALMPFVVGALDHPTQMEPKSQSAMVIGLGGGILDMFLHEKAPNLNITIYELEPMVVKMAHKWFGTVEDETRRTIVGDGLVGIEKAAENGEQFDLVALDACEMFDRSLCPVPLFTTEETLRKVKAILKPTGVFLVNVVTGEGQRGGKLCGRNKTQISSCFPDLSSHDVRPRIKSYFRLPYYGNGCF